MVPEGLSQPDPVPTDALQSLAPSTGCLSQLESGSTAQHRSSGWAAPLAGVQSYSLHTLEDLYHVQGYPTPSPYPFTSSMTMSDDPPPKVGPFSPDEGADTSVLQDPSPWTKEDGSLAWGAYECRRAYWGCQRTSVLFFKSVSVLADCRGVAAPSEPDSQDKPWCHPLLMDDDGIHLWSSPYNPTETHHNVNSVCQGPYST